MNYRKKIRFSSLQLKLSLLFIALLVSVSGVYLFMIMDSTGQYVAEVTQQRNRDLAASIAKELAIDSATNAIPDERMKELFHAAMVINPSIKLYIIGHEGEIMTASAQPGEVKLDTVNVSEIEAFIHQKKPLPIYGDDPREPKVPRVFSATELPNGDGSLHCYLYITLNNSAVVGEEASVKQSYIFKVVGRAFAITLAVIIVIGLLLIFFLTKDLKKMSAAVREMEQGDYSVRMHVKSSDELSELATAFNTMAGEIELAMRQLKQNDELRRELIANISHDLRTPLASVEGYVETILLKSHLLSDHEKQSYLETILKNTRSLGRLVSDLFQLSKLEAKQIQAQPETFSAPELTQDILLQFAPKAEAHEIDLHFERAQDIPLVYADVSLIERVLQNLISNAIQYTPEGGEVLVKVIPDAHRHVRIEVTDTGPGIAQQDLRHIFDRFYQNGHVRSQGKGGLGLGLAIAQKIVALHGSKLQVDSKLGKGTTFWFTLSISQEVLVAKV